MTDKMTDKMTPAQKATRSQTLRIVTQLAPNSGIEVVDQFTLGGRALVGKQGGATVVWLEGSGQWHEVNPEPISFKPVGGVGFAL